MIFYYDPAGAVTGNYLQSVLHIPSRKLSRMIELERREGWPICASKETDPAAGYWLASTREEAEKYAAGGLNAAAEKMKETADLLLTNLKIDDWKHQHSRQTGQRHRHEERKPDNAVTI